MAYTILFLDLFFCNMKKLLGIVLKPMTLRDVGFMEEGVSLS